MTFNRLSDNTLKSWAQRAFEWETNIVAISRTRYRRKFRNAIYICAENMAEASNQVTQHLRRSTEIATTDFNNNLQMLTNEACVSFFRFGHKDLMRIVDVMAWPAEKTCTVGNGYAINPTLAACVVLRRLSSSSRWYDLENLFGKFSPQLAEIFREALEQFMDVRGHLLTSPIPENYFQQRAETFAERVFDKGRALDNCLAFIDGTVIGVSRPSGSNINQRVLYNGHKRKHALKYQAITTPDGMCLHLFGPEVGRRHDMYLYHAAGTDAMLEGIMWINGKQYVVFGDSGYSVRVFLEIPFEGSNLSATKKSFNKAMSKVRVTVEWLFKEVKLLWSMVDSKRRMRICQAPVGLMYRAAVLLTNLRNCVQPNPISQFFDCAPPTLEEYISSRE